MLFNKTDSPVKLAGYPRANYVKFWIQDGVDQITQYYSKDLRYVSRPNFLIRLIDTLNISPYMELEDLIEHLENTALHKCNTIGIVTGNNVNDTTQNAIIHNTDEYYLYNRDHNYDLFDEDAIRYPAIKCICGNHKEIALWHPYEYPLASMDDLWFVYSIDPVALGLMYYKWLKREMDLDKDLDVARFLYEEVFLAVMPSIVDVGMLNRYRAILLDDGIPNFTNVAPMPIKDPSADLNKAQYWMYNRLSKKRDMRYVDLANTISTLTGSMYTLLEHVDDRFIVKQNGWLYDLVKLYWYSMLAESYNSKQEKATHTKMVKEYKYHNKAKWYGIENEEVMILIEEYAKRSKF